MELLPWVKKLKIALQIRQQPLPSFNHVKFVGIPEKSAKAWYPGTSEIVMKIGFISNIFLKPYYQ
jgi:hypothetical protein